MSTTSRKQNVVYKITHLETGCYYFGSTCKLRQRVAYHLSALRIGKHSNVRLNELIDRQRDVSSQIELEILYVFPKLSKARRREAGLIRKNADDALCLNILVGTNFGDVLTRHPHKEAIVTRRTESQLKTSSKLSPEERSRKYGKPGERNGMFGKTHGVEAREKISAANLGVTRRSGFKLTDEHRQKISEIASRRTGERNPFYGRKHTQETKERLSEKRKGNLPTNARSVTVEGRTFVSVTEAARQLGVSPALVIYRLRSPKWDYSYSNENSNDHPAGE